VKSTSSPLLQPHLLSTLSTELDDDNSVALALTGSYIQGEANLYNYVDLVRFVTVLPEQDSRALSPLRPPRVHGEELCV